MQLEGIGAVLQVVFRADHLARQLAQLAHRHKTGIQLVSNGGGENKPPRFHPDNYAWQKGPAQLDQLIDRTRINPELSLILLNCPSVLLSAKYQFPFALAFGLHLVSRDGGGGENRSSGGEKDQRCK